MVKRHFVMITVLFGFSIIMVSMIVYNSIFILNPITYGEDYVTPQEWHQYRAPIEVAYYRWSETGGWMDVGVENDMSESRYIIDELKKLKGVEYSQEDYFIPYISRGDEYKVIIRRETGEQEYVNLVQFDFFEKGNLVDLGNNHYLKLSDGLRELLLERIS